MITFQNLGESTFRAQLNIKAAPEKVYAAWTQQDQFAKWFGPRADGRLEVHRFDVEEGGRYDLTLIFSDGDRIRLLGEYQELDPPTKLVFTWQWNGDGVTNVGETLVTVDIVPTDIGSCLTLTHERFATSDIRDQHHHGWEPLLSKLASLLEI